MGVESSLEEDGSHSHASDRITLRATVVAAVMGNQGVVATFLFVLRIGVVVVVMTSWLLR